jgi:hypothetical protein
MQVAFESIKCLIQLVLDSVDDAAGT